MQSNYVSILKPSHQLGLREKLCLKGKDSQNGLSSVNANEKDKKTEEIV